MPRLPLLWSWVARVLSDVRRRGGVGGWWVQRGGGGGVPRRTRASAGVASASVPSGVIHKTRAAQSTLSRRTDIEALGETQRQRRAGHGLSALPHTCALRSVRSGQWEGSGFGGKADPEVCQYLWCHNTDLCTQQRFGGGGGGGGVFAASTTTEHCRSAGRTGTRCMGRVVHKHTARPSHEGGGGEERVAVRLFGRPHAFRPKSTAPTDTHRGGGGGQELYTQTSALEVRVGPCVSPRLGTRSAPAHGRALGHQQRCGTAPNPKSSAPTTAEARRRRGRGGRRCSTKTPRPFTCSARDLIKTLGFAPTPHDNNDRRDPEPRSTNAGACTARSCGAVQAYHRDPPTSTSGCFSKPR